MYKWLYRRSALFTLAFLPATVSGDITFLEGEFNPIDWTAATQGSGTSVSMQVLAGGNPDEYLAISNRPTPNIGETIFGYHLNTSFIYEPSLFGAVESIEWSFDFTNITNAQLIGMAFEQEGFLFAADSLVRSGSFGFWTGSDWSLLALEDFPAGLDISAEGAPITFGIFSANTFDPAFGDNDNVMGFDNLSITVTSAALLGDVNLDGVVNLLDVAPFVDRISTGTFQAEADINQDGEVNLLDVQPFVDLLSG